MGGLGIHVVGKGVRAGRRGGKTSRSWHYWARDDKLGRGHMFSLFDLVSSFHQKTVHKDMIHLTLF